MLNSEVRLQRRKAIFSLCLVVAGRFTTGASTQGLGRAPALSWLPCIQSGFPVQGSHHNGREGWTYGSILASEYLAERHTVGPTSNRPHCVHVCNARAPVDLAAAPQKIGLRACNSRPSVWPPSADKPKWAEGRPLWQNAPQQTKPLNIPSKSIKASRDWPGLIFGVWYHRTLQGRILVKN